MNTTATPFPEGRYTITTIGALSSCLAIPRRAPPLDSRGCTHAGARLDLRRCAGHRRETSDGRDEHRP